MFPTTGNPVLDEILHKHEELSAPAQKAIAISGLPARMEPQASPQVPGSISIPAANATQPPPTPGAIPIPGAAASPAAPVADSPRMIPIPKNPNLERARSEVSRLTIPTADPATGQPVTDRSKDQSRSGIDKIHSPFLRIPLQVLDAIGSGVVPGITMGIPGTSAHHRLVVNQAENAENQQETQLSEDQKRQLQATQEAETQGRIAGQPAEIDLHKAEAERARALAAAAGEKPTNEWVQISEPVTDPAHPEIGPQPAFFNKNDPKQGIVFGKAPVAAKPVDRVPVEGEMPLGQRIEQLNQLLEKRYQVLNPGKPLPDAYKLPANANQKDYDRIEKSLSGEETASGSKAQRESANAFREQAAAVAADARADRQDRENRRIVTGTDAHGHTVVGSVAESKAGKWTGILDLPAAEQSQVYNARHWVPLADAHISDPVAEPDKAGVLQLIDALDKRGALGTIASRWNEFLTKQGISTGNPETDRMVEALRAKMGLSNTLLMKVHVGNRGGSYMLEHFEDLANQKKLNANMLRAGVKSELDYVKRLAAAPDDEGTQQHAEAHETAPPAAPFAPTVGTVMGGHKFKGGDPSKPENWEKVNGGK